MQPNEVILAESPKSVTEDRQTLYCVPIPGETDWVKTGYKERAQTIQTPSTSRHPIRSKRNFDSDDENLHQIHGNENQKESVL